MWCDVLYVSVNVVVVLNVMLGGIGIIILVDVFICEVKVFWLRKVIMWLLVLRCDMFLFIVLIMFVIFELGVNGSFGLNWYLFWMISMLGKFIFVVFMLIIILLVFGERFGSVLIISDLGGL